MPNLYRCENNKLPEKINNYEYEKRGEKNSSSKKQSKNKKLDFKTCKKNTVKSLNEVEYFLRNFNEVSKYMKLYKILK